MDSRKIVDAFLWVTSTCVILYLLLAFFMAARATAQTDKLMESTMPQVIVKDISPEIPTPYKRRDWPHWDDVDRDCEDTRAEVLREESRVPVALSQAGCIVTEGRWYDPYTGKWFLNASDLDVDHLVPLSHAHAHGGASWSREKKRRYANDMEHPEHLIAVSSRVNRQKGNKGPDQWRPPNRRYWCDYAIYWVSVKTRWGLDVTESELAALHEMVDTCENEGGRVIDDGAVDEQRSAPGTSP